MDSGTQTLIDEVFRKRPNRYGRHTAPSRAYDAVLSSFVADFITMQESDRRTIGASLTALQRTALRTYAARMAEAAVNEGARLNLLHGLVALCLGDDPADYREGLIGASLLRHSAQKISVSYDALLSEAAPYLGGLAPDFIERLRANKSTIGQMGFAEGQGEGGLEYQRII